MANRFILNETSYHGAGAIKEVVTEVKARGLKKGLVVTDKDLIKFGVATKVTDLLDEAGLPYEIYDEVKANPTVEQVKNGVQAAKDAGAHFMEHTVPKFLPNPWVRVFAYQIRGIWVKTIQAKLPLVAASVVSRMEKK